MHGIAAGIPARMVGSRWEMDENFQRVGRIATQRLVNGDAGMLKENVKSAVKAIGKRALPRVYERVRQSRQRRIRARLDRITAELVDRNMLEVLRGPFAGLKYTLAATAAHFPPKLTGAYESELHGVFEKVIAEGYPAIVDVGCSEGYYAVGLAKQCPGTRVYAYDTDENSRRWCAELAGANGVADRVSVRGECNPEALLELGVERGFLLSDCEGYEVQLLDPARAPVLRQWDILVELHDCYDPDTTAKILPRFEQSHEISLILPQPRHARFCNGLEFLSHRDRKLAVSDLRGERTHWAFMRAKNAG